MKKILLFSLLFAMPITFMAKSNITKVKKTNISTAKKTKVDQKQLIDKTDELFVAVEKGKTSSVKRLLKSKSYKIEINRLNKNKQTVLDIAVDNQFTKLAAVLLKYGAKVTTRVKAYDLQRMFDLRASKFFLGGLFFLPLLFGSVFSWSNIKSVNELVL